jgi:hypothetical protein
MLNLPWFDGDDVSKESSKSQENPFGRGGISGERK